MSHITVLLTEAVAALALARNSTVVDGTVGSAGHAVALCAQLGSTGHYIGIDADRVAIAAARERLARVAPKVTLTTGNFSNLENLLSSSHVEAGTVDAVLADLGWRMEQFTDGGKGFSFRVDEPLLMTYGDPSDYAFTAFDIVNDWTETQIATIIAGYGEERYARRIASGIVKARAIAPLHTTGALVHVIESAVPAVYRRGRVHCATRTFQALRMAVNDELTVVEDLISAAVRVLRPGGRLAIITFHSIEDRLVKHRFRELAEQGATIITKRPIVPSSEELAHNPRARSAKLRVISTPVKTNE
jgi:16S rRNA (cytosine1402-N4)-methyltransferase